MSIYKKSIFLQAEKHVTYKQKSTQNSNDYLSKNNLSENNDGNTKSEEKLRGEPKLKPTQCTTMNF